MATGIIGLGRLGSALAQGLHSVQPEMEIYGYNRSREKGEKLAAKISSLRLQSTAGEILKKCDTVFIWTNAADLKAILEENSALIKEKKQLLVSCIPGVPFSEYTPNWVETLPNVNLAAGKGVTLVHYSPSIESGKRAQVESLLKSVGSVYEVPVSDIPYYSALCSCGPALYAALMELFADTLSTRRNYDREFCRRLVRETMSGTVFLQEAERIGAGELIERVAHPGGPSEAGVNHLKEKMPDVWEEMLKKMKKW